MIYRKTSQNIANITKVYVYAEKGFIKHYAPGLADSPDNGQSLCGRPFKVLAALPPYKADAKRNGTFAYEKKDGTLRHAVGTLKGTSEFVKGTGRPDDGQTFRYYDMEAKGFRSFRVENFITTYENYIKLY